jgi:hypothetical protein
MISVFCIRGLSPDLKGDVLLNVGFQGADGHLCDAWVPRG